MPRFDESDDDFYGEDDDAYADLDDAADDPDDEPTVRCSNCGFERLEIIHQCPRCGELPTREFNPTSTQPQWVYVTALILLIALVWLIFV